MCGICGTTRGRPGRRRWRAMNTLLAPPRPRRRGCASSMRTPASVSGLAASSVIDVDGRAPAARQRGRHASGPRSTVRSTTTPTSASELRARRVTGFATAHRHRGPRPPLRGVRRRPGPRASRGCSRSPSGTRRRRRLLRRPRPLRREAALLLRARRRTDLRVRPDRAAGGRARSVGARPRRRRRLLRARLHPRAGHDPHQGAGSFPPGHLMTWELDRPGAGIRRYWSPPADRRRAARDSTPGPGHRDPAPPGAVGRGRG